MFDKRVYIQCKCLSIGSAVTPVLGSLFLALADQTINKSLEGDVVKIFRYVDEYVVFHSVTDSKRELRLANRALSVFEMTAQGLEFVWA